MSVKAVLEEQQQDNGSKIKIPKRTKTVLKFNIFETKLRKAVNEIAEDKSTALSRISPRVRVRDSVSIVYRIAHGGYSWIWPKVQGYKNQSPVGIVEPADDICREATLEQPTSKPNCCVNN